ncbi:MAG: hypothetical protein CVU48_11105 [Candidatus Cloacimonetes bacterium HGW-Cloacimonetes-1]|jgi:parvulin-like peptidyl-prolyl isomerase|nr:MAG: hypothetical protein CVU48_11105 [Candidatus Cloacimonetes bacterium HGW-Cloacimonetes-1]
MKRLALLSIVLLIFIVGCHKATKESAKLAQVGSEYLRTKEFKSLFSTEEWENLSSESKKKYIEQWVNLTLMAQEADRQKIDEDEAIKQKIEYAAKKVKANALIATRLAAIKISEEELFNYYRIHQGDFQKPLMEYKVQRIFVADIAKAEKIKQDMSVGMSFDRAVQTYSQEDLKSGGGYMGFVSSTGPDSLFWYAVKDQKPTETTLMTTSNGCYLLRYVEERSTSKEVGFEEYKAEIRRRIQQEKRQQVYTDLLLELKQKNPDIYYY